MSKIVEPLLRPSITNYVKILLKTFEPLTTRCDTLRLYLLKGTVCHLLPQLSKSFHLDVHIYDVFLPFKWLVNARDPSEINSIINYLTTLNGRNNYYRTNRRHPVPTIMLQVKYHSSRDYSYCCYPRTLRFHIHYHKCTLFVLSTLIILLIVQLSVLVFSDWVFLGISINYFLSQGSLFNRWSIVP